MIRESSETEIALADSLGQIPSVTEILEAMKLGPNYNGVPAARLERKRLFGQALHRAIQYDVEGALDEATLHPDIIGGFRAYRAVLESGFRVERAEVELIDPQWRVKGHPDALATAPHGAPAIIDWKFAKGYDLDAAAYQLAAYRWLVRQVLGEDRMPYVIELHADGRPNVTALGTRIAELNAEQVFLASVVVYHAQRRRA